MGLEEENAVLKQHIAQICTAFGQKIKTVEDYITKLEQHRDSTIGAVARLDVLQSLYQEVREILDEGAKAGAMEATESALPDDLVALTAFADQHMISRNETERRWKSGFIPVVRGLWGSGKQRVSVALDGKGRRDFWVQFHNAYGFRACDDCPHSEQATENENNS